MRSLQKSRTLFITRELHTPKALGCMGSAASIKSTQQGQRDRVEVVYVQNPPTKRRSSPHLADQ
jgi:hypothetical protein